MSQECEDSFTEEELMYLRVAIARYRIFDRVAPDETKVIFLSQI